MLRNLLLLGLLMMGSLNIHAQRNCGAMDVLEQNLQQDQKLQKKMEAIEKATNKIISQNDKAVTGVITIPVVVHVVYNTSAENISDAQIQTQLDVLNEDFRRLNSDADNVWAQAADTEIEFCLASIDPLGNATSGITRTSTSVSAFGTNDNMKFNSSGGKDAWPYTDYMNLWVCDISGGILGYAQFPGGSGSTDGVVIDYQYFGTIGTATSPFDMGRTGTHEVGHWLNLRHIWGDGNCNADDFVTDTPSSDAANYGCALGHVSCSSTDMVQNYMDYSDDACMNLYTSGQTVRMRALFEPGQFRASLLNSPGCGAVNPPTCNDGIQNGNETGIDCGGPDCQPCSSSCNDNLVNVNITFDNYPEETSWIITNSSGSTVASGGTYGSNPDGSSISIEACLVDGCYNFIISDSYGDGICCAYGNGSYNVTDGNGNVLASGGSFGSSESTNFCLTGGPAPTCTDGIQNGDETDVDCGGSDCPACPTCSDGVQNGSETGVDCGGPDCAACPTCSDGIQNGDETGVDCGGSDCPACPTCSDGVQNGNETGVDCGGPDCAPCNTGCNGTEVTLTIVFDNYSSETSWNITNSGGSVVASGNNYGSYSSGSSIDITECLSDGCYTLTMNDSYGDGICCSYGNGSYVLSDEGGTTLASGGAFGSSESTAFCVGGSSGPSCTDGIQNGDETGVDCGGSCAPCNTGCSTVLIDFNNFDSSWGIWNDGGSDCARSSSAANAFSGIYSIRLRDNTSTSTMTTDNIALASFEEVTINFTYIAQSMENGEDFWLQASTNGGSTYQTLATWASNSDFTNGVREFESVTITGNFTNTTRFRFRCDASGNSDYIYIDDVEIEGCSSSAKLIDDNANKPPIKNEVTSITDVNVYPVPARDVLNVSFNSEIEEEIELVLFSTSGELVASQKIMSEEGQQVFLYDVNHLSSAVYLLQLRTSNSTITKRIVIIR